MIFRPGGRRDALLAEMWPSTAHWRDVMAALNAIPEGPPVKRGTMIQRARKLGVRRPFPPGRFGREIMLGLPTTLALIFFAWPAPAQPLRYTPDPQRSADVVREYRAANPCPATGLTTGACPGWAVDHRWPLCAGGADAVDNLGWMADADKLKKDRFEWAVCRHLRKLRGLVEAVR